MAVEIMSLSSGYARTKKAQAEVKKYRRMTVEEAKGLSYGDHVPFLANDGTVREVKVNGAPKVWKRDSGRVEIAVKYGMYEYAHVEGFNGGTVQRLLVEVEG